MCTDFTTYIIWVNTKVCSFISEPTQSSTRRVSSFKDSSMLLTTERWVLLVHTAGGEKKRDSGTFCKISRNTFSYRTPLVAASADSMILAKYTKSVSSQLFGCSSAKLRPLDQIWTLIWQIGSLNLAKCPGNLPTWMWRLNLHSHSQCFLLYVKKWERNWEIDFWRTYKIGRVTLK